MVAAACSALIVVGAGLQLRILRHDLSAVLSNQQAALSTQLAGQIDDKLRSGLLALQESAAGIASMVGGSPAELREALARQVATARSFDDLLVVDPQGRIVADYPELPARTGPLPVGRAQVQRTFESGQSRVWGPMIGPMRGEPIVVFASPVLDPEHRVSAVLLGVVRLYRDNFLGDLASARLGDKGYLAIATAGADPVYVMYPDRSRILQPVREHSVPAAVRLRNEAQVGTPPVIGPAVNGADESGADETGADETGAGEARVGIDGSVLMAQRRLHNADWVALAALPVDEAFAPIRRAQRRVLLLAVALLVLCPPLVWLFVRRLLDPVTSLHAAVVRMREQGDALQDATLSIPVGRRDEIGELAQAFGQLVDELQTRVAEIRAIHDALPLGLFRADETGANLYVNRTAEQIHGMPAHGLLGHEWQRSLTESSRQRMVKEWLQTVHDGRYFESLQEIRRTDGELRLLSVLGAPIVRNGRCVGYVGTVQDVTEQRANDDARRMLGVILENSPDAVAIIDRGCRIRHVNAAGLLMSGVTDGVSGASIDRFFPAEVVRRLRREALRTAIRAGVWSGETLLTTPAGHLLPLHQTVLAVRGASGRIDFIASVMRDISSARRAEQALRDSEKQMRTLADNVPAVIAYLDAGMRFRFANRAWREWFGLTSEQVLGKSLHEMYGTAVLKRVLPYIERALRGHAVEYERQISTAGQLRDVVVSAIPDANEAGHVAGLHLLMTDVTAKKVEERRLMQMAQFDLLTGLMNRAGFDQALRDAMARTTRTGAPMALLYVDVDRFKSINDSLGHLAGDTLLRQFAKRLASVLRSSDVVSRLGGDEFVVILENIGAADAVPLVAGKVVQAMREAFLLEGQLVRVSASVGVAIHAGGEADAEDLLRRADKALYRSKREGRDRFRLEVPETA